MEKVVIEAYARELAEITIKKHKEKSLGKERMSIFIKNNLNNELKDNDYEQFLHLYSKYLAKEGYEIKKDINKFDIIDYGSEEYQIYINSIN